MNSSKNLNKNTFIPSLFTKNNLIYLQKIGIIAPYINGESTNSYLFYIVLEGNTRIIYNHEEITISQGDCIFIDCRKKYELISLKKDSLKASWVHFYGVNLDNIYDMFIKNNGSYIFTTRMVYQYEDLLSQIYMLSNKNGFDNDMKIYELLVRLLNYIIDEDKEHKSLSNKIKVEPVKEYIDQHYVEHITLDDLSERFYINKYYLSKLFKEKYGLSIIAYINRLRINKSKELLKMGNHKIESICQICGIEDQSYFIRLFKKIEGITPGEYRKIWNGM